MKLILVLTCSLFVLALSGCANVKLTSQDGNQYTFCSNPGNAIAGPADFDAAAAKQCGNGYKKISESNEAHPDTVTIGKGWEKEMYPRVTQKQKCAVYECK